MAHEGLLRRLDELVARARLGWSGVALVVGEAGAGKSRLLRELAARADRSGARVCWTGSPGPDTAAAAEHEPGAGPTPIRPQPLVVLGDGTVPWDQMRLVAGGAPVAAPTVVVVTALPGDLRTGGDLHALLGVLARHGALVELEVPPLQPHELLAHATQVLGAPPGTQLRWVLSELSEGNPWLAEEVADDLLRAGALGRRRGAWELREKPPPDYVPEVVRAVVRHQIAALDPAIGGILGAAAVLGPAFDLDALAAVVGRDAGSTLAAIEPAVELRIILETDEPGADFRFAHELVRRVVYQRLGRLRRRHLHAAVARSIEGRDGSADSAEGRARLAHHLARGTQPGRALEHVLVALDSAEQLCEWDEAIRHCRQGVDLARQTEQGGAQHVALLERLAALHWGRAQTLPAATCWREALRLCQLAETAWHTVALMARLAALGPAFLPVEPVEAALERVLRDRGEPSDEVERRWLFDACLELGLATQRHGRLGDSLRFLERACALVQPSDWVRWSQAHQSLGELLTSAGRPLEAVRVERDVLALLDRHLPEGLAAVAPFLHVNDPRRTRCLALGNLARALAYTDAQDEALRVAQAGREEERRFRFLGGRAHRAVAHVELGRGRPHAALRALASSQAHGSTGLLAAHRAADLVLASRAHLADGDAHVALDVANEGLRICERSGAREHLAGLQLAASRALLGAGQPGPALQAAVRAEELIAEGGSEIYRVEALLTLAEARRQLGMGGVGELVEEARLLRRAMFATSEPGREPGTGSKPDQVDGAAGKVLSDREREVLLLVAAGHTNRRIADALVVSDKTVKRHLENIFVRLNVATRAAAVKRAYELGLLLVRPR